MITLRVRQLERQDCCEVAEWLNDDEDHWCEDSVGEYVEFDDMCGVVCATETNLLGVLLLDVEATYAFVDEMCVPECDAMGAIVHDALIRWVKHRLPKMACDGIEVIVPTGSNVAGMFRSSRFLESGRVESNGQSFSSMVFEDSEEHVGALVIENLLTGNGQVIKEDAL